ncbi:MAG: hypothetical protein ACK5QX_08350, partial [bacterium]
HLGHGSISECGLNLTVLAIARNFKKLIVSISNQVRVRILNGHKHQIRYAPVAYPHEYKPRHGGQRHRLVPTLRKQP